MGRGWVLKIPACTENAGNDNKNARLLFESDWNFHNFQTSLLYSKEYLKHNILLLASYGNIVDESSTSVSGYFQSKIYHPSNKKKLWYNYQLKQETGI